MSSGVDNDAEVNSMVLSTVIMLLAELMVEIGDWPEPTELNRFSSTMRFSRDITLDRAILLNTSLVFWTLLLKAPNVR